MNTAYTIGSTRLYDESLSSRPTYKQPGGWIWKSSLDAFDFIQKGLATKAFPHLESIHFSVYSVDLGAPWLDTVSEQVEDDGVHILKCKVKVIGKLYYVDGIGLITQEDYDAVSNLN